jgi:hypothetical protein
MIYKLIIGLVLIATVIYYLFCFLEIFGVIKFTDKNTTVKIPQMFIPFYYLLVSGEEKVDESLPKDSRISVSIGDRESIDVSYNIAQASIHISDEDYHGWRIDLPDWVSLENNIGQGTKSVVITIKRNARKDARHGSAIITDLKTDDVYEIEINQEAKSEN